MDKDQFTNLLFYPRPEQWGHRGDPMLWTDLENHIRRFEIMPDSINNFRESLKTLYQQLVGEPLKKGSTVFVNRYQHVGMSSGIVSADFWIETAIPLLIQRYKIAKSNQIP